MQSAAAIQDAVRRLEEAAAVFRLKSRNATEEYSELNARWTDSRARKFTAQHIEPQRDWIEQGGRLCHAHLSLAETARAAAEEAERELSGFFAAQSAYESAADSARQSARAARDQATQAETDSARVSAALRSTSGDIAATASDPGW
jgi:hypothetical protein